MNIRKYFKPLFTIIISLAGLSASAQIDIVNNDTAICEGQSVLLHANTNGRTPIQIPLTVDDIYSDVINIGFPFTFYGNTYTQCVVSANGFISFDIANANLYSAWTITEDVPGNPQCLNAIMAPYSDIDPSVSGGSIDYAIMGTAPFRRFVVSFCNAPLYSCNNLKSSFQIVLYETTNIIDIHVVSQPSGLCTTWNNGYAIEGVHDATGTYATVVPGRNYPSVWTAYNDSHRFTPNGNTDYTVAPIPHLPIPDSLAQVTWYSGGFQVGTGLDFLFTYTTTQTLVAMVTQCQDTLTDTVTVTVNQIYNITDVDSTNPSQCEASDGTISLYGFFPGLPYTVHYTDPLGNNITTTIVADNAGILLITGLAEGNYTNFYVVSPEGCISNVYTPIPLYDPGISIDTAIGTFPTACQGTDGFIVLEGLIAGVTYTISYTFNGNPQTIVLTADGNGNVTIPNLTAGTYSNFTATTSNCTSNMLGPLTLQDPVPVIDAANPVNPTLCRAADGTITLTGLLADSTYIVRYTLNTVPFTITLVANGAGEVIVPNLIAGLYDNITVQLLTCVSDPVGPVTLVNPPVTADFTSQLFPGCTEDTVAFTDISSGSAYPFTYLWQFGDSSTAATVQNPSHIYDEQGTYAVTLIITDSVCRDTVVHDVVIDHPLIANFTTDKDTVCQNEAVTFTDASTATGPVTYTWHYGTGDSSTISSNTQTYTYTRPGTILTSLVISDFIGCKDTANKYVRVDSLTEILISFDSTICAGEKLKLTASYEDTGSTGINWDFGDGIITQTSGHYIEHSYEAPGLYNIHVIATSRVCPDVDSVELLTVLPQPVINLGPDTSMCPTSGALVLQDLENAGNPLATWAWRFGDRALSETSFKAIADVPGWYASVVTIGECSATDSVWVKKDCYIDVPNAFTPDGDNMNDYFIPREWLSRGVTSFKMLIFNRWGQEIYSTTNINGRGWDGKFNGEDQPQGVYVYVIDVTFKDGRVEHKQGNVTLLR